MAAEEKMSSVGDSKLEDVNPEEKEQEQNHRSPAPAYETYPTPPTPQVTFIRPHGLRSPCLLAGLLAALVVSLLLNFFWVTIALGRALGADFSPFGSHHAEKCECFGKADMPAINFAPIIEVYPAQGGPTTTPTPISTYTTAVMPTTPPSSELSLSTTVVVVTPQRSIIKSTTIITITPEISESNPSTVFSTTVVTL